MRAAGVVSGAFDSVWSFAVFAAATVGTVVASMLAAPGVSGLFGAALAVTMIVIAAIDARHFVIPDRLVLTGLLLGLFSAAIDQSAPTLAPVEPLLRGVALALAFLTCRIAYRRLRRREGIGLGDVKLAAVAGVWLSWEGAAIAIDIATLSALAAVLVRAAGGRRISASTAIPFGLFFAPAIWVAWLLSAVSARLILL